MITEEQQKKATAEYLKRWREKNKDRTAAYAQAKAKRISARWHSDEDFRKSRLEYHRQWRSTNKDKAYAAELRWKAKNPDKVAAKKKRHRKNAPSAQPEYQRRRYRTDPEYRAKVIVRVTSREAQKKSAGGRFTQQDIKNIWERQKHKCAVPNCINTIAASGPNKYHIDHIQALANGGGNGPENLQLLCRTHNLTKHTKDEYEWAQSVGMLFPR